MSGATAADKYVYDETLESEILEKPFTSKEMQFVFDTNNGTYNNQILFSTGMMNSTGKWVDFQNSYLEIPFTMAMRSTAQGAGGAGVAQDITGVANPFMMGLKNGSIQLIDSIILQYNGTSVIQNSIFTNVMQHFKILASWTQEDLTKWGAATMFAPDQTNSFKWTAGTTASPPVGGPFGDGTSNTNITPPTAGGIGNAGFSYNTTSYTSNSGYLKRLQYAGLNSTTAMDGPRTESAQSASLVGKNYYGTTGAGSNTIYYWQVLLTIRCKDISDFFNKIPVMKAGRIDLTINFNAFTSVINFTPGAAGPPIADGKLATASYNQLSGHTCPYMVSGAAVGPYGVAANAPVIGGVGQQPLALSGVVATGLTTGCGINGVTGVSALSSVGSPAFNNCRWYIPTFECDPVYEQQLLATNPIKTIYYDDFYTYTSIKNVSTSFQNLITSGVKNPQYVVLFPFYSSANAYSGTCQNNSPFESVFDSAPATTSPVSISDFQVQCGGRTMFPLIETYTFQQFMDEFSSIYALNGGKSDIVTSGLINKDQWEKAPVYICNLSRRLPSDDGTAKSVQVSGTIRSQNPVTFASGATIDIIAFVVYQRKCEFNLLNGLLVSDSI
jgi:hypothetical protein